MFGVFIRFQEAIEIWVWFLACPLDTIYLPDAMSMIIAPVGSSPCKS